jgi:peptidyl-prolyl cis-trans isomerase A (cyclophilin A)
MKTLHTSLIVMFIGLLGALGCDDGSTGSSSAGDAIAVSDAVSDAAEPPGDDTTVMSDADAVTDATPEVSPDVAPADSSMTDATPTAPDANEDGATQVLIVTTLGDFVVEMNPDAAPATVANFLSYVDMGFYDGADDLGATHFHRVIADFMVQGGGYTVQGAEKATLAAIAHESPNGLSNLRGTVAMARTNDFDSATSQFYINHIDNLFLDYMSPAEPGYVVFGEVVMGMDTIDAIAAVATDGTDQPLTPVVLESVSVVTDGP